jgi:hypothetical protein
VLFSISSQVVTLFPQIVHLRRRLVRLSLRRSVRYAFNFPPQGQFTAALSP